MTDLGTLGGGFSQAFAINDLGQVVGYSETAEGEQHAFLWEAGRMTDLGPVQAFGVNQRAQVFGVSLTATGDAHATRWEVR